jgi:hypothetical protein
MNQEITITQAICQMAQQYWIALPEGLIPQNYPQKPDTLF